jgi:hypothetical protein
MEEAGAQSTSSAAANEAQERENMTNWEAGQRGRDAEEAAVSATHGCNASTSIAAAEVEVSIAPTSGEATHEKPAPADTATAKEPPSLGLGLSYEALPEVGKAIPAAEQEHESGAPAAEPASPAPVVAINDGTSEGVAAAAATSSTCKEYTIEKGGGATLVLNEVPTHTSPRVTANGIEWVHLYDVEERAPYWFCEATQVSQWEEPGTAGAVEAEAEAAAGAAAAAAEAAGGAAAAAAEARGRAASAAAPAQWGCATAAPVACSVACAAQPPGAWCRAACHARASGGSSSCATRADHGTDRCTDCKRRWCIRSTRVRASDV